MIKKRIALSLSLCASLVFSPIVANAANMDQSSSQTSIEMNMISDDQYSDNEDPEVKYAYDGEDYVYAIAEVNEKEYAIPRSKYGAFLDSIETIGIREEYFYPAMKEIEAVEEETQTGQNREWVKDTATPWDEWDDETWSGFFRYAEAFRPDEWQSKMLEIYTLKEIYAHYMGLGYEIDEYALKEYLDFEYTYILNENGEKVPVEKTEEEIAEEQKKAEEEEKAKKTAEVLESYTKVGISYDIDSVYSKKIVFCVSEVDKSYLYELMTEYDLLSKTELQTTNPNAYANGFYSFEIGTGDEYVCSYDGIPLNDAFPVINYISSNTLDDEDVKRITAEYDAKLNSEHEKESENEITSEVVDTSLKFYTVNLKTKLKDKNVSLSYLVDVSTVAKISSDFLASYAPQTPSVVNINAEATAVE